LNGTLRKGCCKEPDPKKLYTVLALTKSHYATKVESETALSTRPGLSRIHVGV